MQKSILIRYYFILFAYLLFICNVCNCLQYIIKKYILNQKTDNKLILFILLICYYILYFAYDTHKDNLFNILHLVLKICLR